MQAPASRVQNKPKQSPQETLELTKQCKTKSPRVDRKPSSPKLKVINFFIKKVQQRMYFLWQLKTFNQLLLLLLLFVTKCIRPSLLYIWTVLTVFLLTIFFFINLYILSYLIKHDENIKIHFVVCLCSTIKVISFD